MLKISEYKIAWICAIETELSAARLLLDEEHEGVDYRRKAGDDNLYVFGQIGVHKVVIATLPSGEYGTNSAAVVARDLVRSFPHIKVGLMVGIGGGAPLIEEDQEELPQDTGKDYEEMEVDIRLGDVVVSNPGNGNGGVIQYLYGKAIQGQGFKQTGFLNSPPKSLRTAVALLKSDLKLKKIKSIDELIQSALADQDEDVQKEFGRPNDSTDRLYQSAFVHTNAGKPCSRICKDQKIINRSPRGKAGVRIHYGLIASGDQLIKDAEIRDRLAREHNVICFEMEAAGIMNQLPFLVIRGICDYSDSHKDGTWQGYAAMTAAAYAKKLLLRLSVEDVVVEIDVGDVNEIKQSVQDTSEKVVEIRQLLIQQSATALQADVERWLEAPDTWPDFEFARRTRDPDTGTWLVESDVYLSWRNGDLKHLWLHGKAGCGKTVISTTIVEDIQSICEREKELGYAMFYFTFRDGGKQQYIHCLRSVIHQLSKTPATATALQGLYQKCREKPNASLLEKGLEDLLATAVQSYKQFYLVLDGLDESPETNTDRERAREKLLEWLHKLAGLPKLQIVATSRRLHDIETQLTEAGFQEKSMIAECINLDIHRYVANQVSKDTRLSKLNPTIIEKVQDIFKQKADGMFRWAACQMDEMKNLQSTQPSDILMALDNLPATLEETYERMLSRIPVQLQGKAMNLLRWIAYSKPPLTMTELSETRIIKLDGAETSVDVNDRGMPDDVLLLLAGLITVVYPDKGDPKEIEDVVSEIETASVDLEDQAVDKNDSKVEDSNDDLEENGNAKDFVDDASLIESSDEDVHDELDDNDSDKDSDDEYVDDESDDGRVDLKTALAYYMADDMSSTASSLSSVSKLPEVESSDPRIQLAHFSVQEYLESEHLLAGKYSKFHFEPEIASQYLSTSCVVYLLHYARLGSGSASYQDLIDFPLLKCASVGWWVYDRKCGDQAKHLEFLRSEHALARWTSIYSPDGSRQSKEPGGGLYYAANLGIKPAVEMLLAAGADVNAVGGNLGNPLQAACDMGYTSIVQLLIDHGADVNARGGHYKFALVAACRNDESEIVKILVDAGANLDVTTLIYGTPLMTAAEWGYNSIVRILIDAGADVNFGKHTDGPALMRASASGHDETVKILITAGADLNAENMLLGTALVEAVRNGHESTVKVLLDAGAMIDPQGLNSWSALLTACGDGRMDIANVLIEAGANVNAVCRFGTALGKAAFEGHELVVKMLMDAGADVNLGAKYYGTPLYTAIDGGHEDVVRMLIDAGADVNAGDLDRTALQIASVQGRDVIVKMLIDAKADVNLCSKRFGSALYAAAKRGYQSIVGMLIDAGADVNAIIRDRTALQAASAKGHDLVAKLLIEAGAK